MYEELMIPDSLPFEVVVPMCKSLTQVQEDGSIILGGVASDNSLDLQRERVPPTLLQKCLPYLSQWGKVNWNHRPDDIGDVFEARLMTAAEVEKQFGRQIEGQGTFLKSRLYPLVPMNNGVDVNSEDLKTAHHRVRAGARMGWSLQGAAVRKSGGISAVFANKVALCPQAINTNSFATVMAKSLGAVMDLIDEEGRAEAILKSAGENPHFLISCPDLEEAIGAAPVNIPAPLPGQVTISRSVLTRLVKSAIMTAGGGVDAAEYTDGRALGRESLEGQVYCEGCGCKYHGKPGEKCSRCGQPLQDIATKVAKSLEFLEALARGDV
jgi:hypothetical protein